MGVRDKFRINTKRDLQKRALVLYMITDKIFTLQSSGFSRRIELLVKITFCTNSNCRVRFEKK